MKKYVLTGGPSIGKTTLIEILVSMGYSIVPEAARMVIEQERVKKSEALPWKNVKLFQEKVADQQIKLEEVAEGNFVFMDRSIIDGAGYCKLGNVETPKIIGEVARNRYDKIFVLNPLPNFENDGIRFEDVEMAKKVHQYIIDAYINFGYEPIFVPVLPPKERVEYILEKIAQNYHGFPSSRE